MLSVLAFHLGLSTFSGGYVGVDVFFVVSGFLITRIIREAVANGRFSFSDFYLRRARRILPALFFTLSVCFGVGFLMLAPEHMQPFSASLTAAILSFSNVYFWLHSSYFDVGSKLSPLLHTWSLGVEEQFYIAYPLILVVLLRRIRRWTWLVLLALGVASFLANLIFEDGTPNLQRWWPAAGEIFKDGPSTIFFLAPFRAFEFAIGGLLAFAPAIKSRHISEASFAIGVTLLGYSVITFTETTLFPSWNALIPCFAAAAMISAQQSRLSQLSLGNPVAAYMGRISYSVYLIHWPIIVFYTYAFSVTRLSSVEMLIITLASIAAGAAMHRYIERPFRSRSNYRQPAFRVAVTVFAGAIIALALTANAARLDGGFAWRLPPDAAAMVPAWSDRGSIMGSRGCTGICEFGTPGKPTILVFGDSHVDHYTKALERLYGDKFFFREAQASSCFVGASLISPRFGKPNPDCLAANQLAKKWLAEGNAAAIIHAQYWDAYQKSGLENPNGTTIKFATIEDMYRRQIADVKALYAGYSGPIILLGSNVPTNLSCYRRPSYLTLPCPAVPDRALKAAFAKEIRAAASSWPQMHFVDPEDIICDDERCQYLNKSGDVLYTDRHHFSFEGAKIVAPHIMDELQKALVRSENAGLADDRSTRSE